MGCGGTGGGLSAEEDEGGPPSGNCVTDRSDLEFRRVIEGEAVALRASGRLRHSILIFHVSSTFIWRAHLPAIMGGSWE